MKITLFRNFAATSEDNSSNIEFKRKQKLQIERGPPNPQMPMYSDDDIDIDDVRSLSGVEEMVQGTTTHQPDAEQHDIPEVMNNSCHTQRRTVTYGPHLMVEI